MRVGQARSVPMTTDSIFWFRELVQALEEINGAWASEMRVAFRHTAGITKLDFRIVSRSIKELIEIDAAKPKPKRRGTFGPTFKGQDADEEDEEEEPRKPATYGRGGGRGRGQGGAP
jgi:hypothetical protein